MKKFLFVAAAVASMVFTGCINEDDTYPTLFIVDSFQVIKTDMGTI